jgi:hypothetical protein
MFITSVYCSSHSQKVHQTQSLHSQIVPEHASDSPFTMPDMDALKSTVHARAQTTP